MIPKPHRAIESSPFFRLKLPLELVRRAIARGLPAEDEVFFDRVGVAIRRFGTLLFLNLNFGGSDKKMTRASESLQLSSYLSPGKGVSAGAGSHQRS